MPEDAASVVTPDDVTAAQDRIADVAHETPLDVSTTFADMSGAASVGLKLENMQRTGSFKIRGAYNAMATLSDAVKARGVIASSAGNHAQGVALAGQLLDIDTTIVVPENTPAAKIAATRGYGAEVVVEGDIYERAYEHALELADEAGYEFVHPFNDADVIAGQGTVGIEIADQHSEVDTVLVAIGGGGLISGIATAMDHYDPDVRVIGVQPEGAAHAKPSLERGEIHELSDVDTVAEGIADTRLLEKTFVVMDELVDDIVTVTDDDLTVALTLLAERAKTVVETAGAAPVAAILADAVDVTDEHAVAVVSGGNVDLTEHGELARSGLMSLDRYVEARLQVDAWPTNLGDIADVVSAHGAKLDAVQRAPRTDADSSNRTPVTVGLEGSGPDNLREVVRALGDLDGVAVASHTLE